MTAQPTYKVTWIGGYSKFMPAPPGYSRIVTYDEAGMAIEDVTSHYVCLIGESGRCMFCGKRHNEPKVKLKEPPRRWWQLLT